MNAQKSKKKEEEENSEEEREKGRRELEAYRQKRRSTEVVLRW